GAGDGGGAAGAPGVVAGAPQGAERGGAVVAEAEGVDRLPADDPAHVAGQVLVREPPRPADHHHLHPGAVTARLPPRRTGADAARGSVEMTLAAAEVGRNRGRGGA